MKWKKPASQVGFVVVLLLLWQLLAGSGLWQASVFPTPGSVLGSLWQMLGNGSLAGALKVSLLRLILGYLLAAVLGLGLGLLAYQVPLFGRGFTALIPGFLSLPSICWLPLASIWFVEPEKAIQFVIVCGAFFSIAHATESGMRHVPPVWVKAARTMGSRGWRLAASVLLPAALPSIVTGLKQGWAFAWRALMAGELLSSTIGLGNLLQQGRASKNMSMLFALILAIMVLSWAVDFLVFTPLEQRVRAQFGMEG